MWDSFLKIPGQFFFSFRFQKEVLTHNNVRGYRFTPSKDVFADVSVNPENECFCPSGPPCTPHGMFNVSLCQYGKYSDQF